MSGGGEGAQALARNATQSGHPGESGDPTLARHACEHRAHLVDTAGASSRPCGSDGYPAREVAWQRNAEAVHVKKVWPVSRTCV